MAENPSNFYNNFIKYANPPAGGCNWDSDFYRSQYISAIMLAQIKDGNYIKSGLVPSIGAGFNIDYTAGVAIVGGAEFDIASGSIAAAAAPIGGVEFNCVYVDDTGTVVVIQADPAETCAAIAIVDTDDTTILRLMEARQLQQFDTTPNPVFQKHIIDGDFNFWYEGVSQTLSGYGSDTMWQNLISGSTFIHSQQAFTNGQADVPGNPKYFSRTVVSSVVGTGNRTSKRQSIEGVQTLSGNTATISFYAKADAVKNIAIELYQDFGSGGSPSTDVEAIGSQLIALTTSWEKYTVTIAIPSISGKTIGTDNNDNLRVTFWFDAGSNYDTRTASLGQQSGTFDISRVRIVEGEEDGDHINEDLQVVETLVGRYYEHSFGSGVYPQNGPDTTNFHTSTGIVSGCASNVLAHGGNVSFAVKKRVTPVITRYGNSLGEGRYQDPTNAGINLWDSTVTPWLSSRNGFNFRQAIVSNTLLTCQFHYKADARL